jgi:hypothetical protein
VAWPAGRFGSGGLGGFMSLPSLVGDSGYGSSCHGTALVQGVSRQFAPSGRSGPTSWAGVPTQVSPE